MEPPWAALAILCPNAWLHNEGEGENHAQDYSVCFLPNDHSVLPRGRLSAADRALARSSPNADEVFLGLRVAALRCAFESVGVMIAANPPPDFARRELQKILQREGPMAFHAFLDDWGIRLRPQELIEISWFLSPREEHIFLATVPDATEASWAQGFWAPPGKLLELYQKQELDLTWAEWYLLHELCQELPQFHGLPDLVAKSGSCLWSGQALHLVPLSPTSLLLPGDEDHPQCPGKRGQRHRLHLKENAQVHCLERNEGFEQTSRL